MSQIEGEPAQDRVIRDPEPRLVMRRSPTQPLSR